MALPYSISKLTVNPTGLGMPASGPKPRPKPPVKKPKPQPSYQQLARQEVQRSLAPILSSLNTQGADLGQYQSQQQNALKSFTDQVMQYITGIPQQVGGTYDQAINTTNQLAQTAATGLANLNPNAQTQADLAAIGAPAAQQQALATQNQNVFGGGAATLYETGGAIPATQMAGEKAAQLAFYQGLPAVAGLQGTQAFKQLLFTQAKDKKALADKIAEINAKRPGLIQEALGSLQENAIAAEKVASQEAYQKSLMDYRNAQLNKPQLQTLRDGSLVAFFPKSGKIQTVRGPNPVIVKDAGGVYSIDPKTGQISTLKSAPLKTVGSSAQTGIYTVDPVTGEVTEKVKPLPRAPKTQSRKDGSLWAVGEDGSLTQILPPLPQQPKIHFGKNGSITKVDPGTGQVTQIAPPGTTGKQNSISAAARRNAKKTVSPNKYADLKLKAATDIQEAIDDIGPDDPERDYQDFLKIAMSQYSLKLIDAQKLLDQHFKPGQNGRPYINYQQRQKLYRAFPGRKRLIDAAMWDPDLAAQFGVLIGG